MHTVYVYMYINIRILWLVGVANYYTTKNVGELEVGVLLFLSLNVFQPLHVRIWNKRMCRELMKVIISKTLAASVILYSKYSTSSLLTLQSRWGRIIHFSPLYCNRLLLLYYRYIFDYRTAGFLLSLVFQHI